MDLFTQADLKILLGEHAPPCVSIFMPTKRGGSQEDMIRWRNHLSEAEESLLMAGWHGALPRELLLPARQLLDDCVFWKHQGDGLAAFLAQGFLRTFRLPLALRDRVVVGARFSIVPLLPLLSGTARFFILALSQNNVRLLQGTRNSISEVDLDGIPRSLADALVRHDRDEPLTFHTRPTSGGGWAPIFEGHGVGIDDAKDDLLIYFQQINRGLQRILAQEKAPLVLASVDYLQPIFHQVSSYPHLLEEGIDGNPDRLSNTQLHERAWQLIKPLFETAQKDAAVQYEQLAGSEYVSSDIDVVVAAAYEGRVETLFVAQNEEVWGVLDPSTKQVQRHEKPVSGDVDLLDLAVAHTLAHGRTVYVVPPAQVPSGTCVAAIFWHHVPKHGKRP